MPANEHDLIEHNMTNHPPVREGIVDDFEELREQAKSFGKAIVDLCPVTRERALALTNLEQALMWAIAGLARNQ